MSKDVVLNMDGEEYFRFTKEQLRKGDHLDMMRRWDVEDQRRAALLRKGMIDEARPRKYDVPTEDEPF